jgi:lysophospholipase L1-like esterase
MKTATSKFALGAMVIAYAGIVWFLSKDSLFHVYINIGMISVLSVTVSVLLILAIWNPSVSTKLPEYGLLISSVFIALLVLEGGFRLNAYRNDLRREHALEQLTQPSRPELTGALVGIIRYSKNPLRVYELIPNISVKFLGQPLTTDSNGFRTIPEPSNKNTGGTVSIMGLGDSVMFGWKVNNQETYLAQLSELLNTSFPDISWKVVNTAVPGYNTVMEIATLQDERIHYQPKFVIIDYVLNDWELPNFLKCRDNYFSLQNSYLMEFISRRLQREPHKMDTGFRYGNLSKIPEQYKAFVGKESYIRAMSELKAWGLQYNFQIVLICSTSELPIEIKQICQQLGIPFIEVFQLASAYVAEHNMSAEQLRISKSDGHLSVLGHDITARILFDYIRQHNQVILGNRE